MIVSMKLKLGLMGIDLLLVLISSGKIVINKL